MRRDPLSSRLIISYLSSETVTSPANRKLQAIWGRHRERELTNPKVEKVNATILEQLGPSLRTIYSIYTVGQIGFNCQLPLSEIGLTADSSHSTWYGFIKPARSIEIKLHAEDLAQHVLFDTGRRRTRHGPLLAPKILPFLKELEFHLFSISRVLMCAPLRPPKMDSFF